MGFCLGHSAVATLTALYNLSLNWSVCPDTFKRANLCVVPKEGRRDKSNPRSYRLISLQSTLGKGLERVIAKRLAYEAVERTIIPHNYVCATPKRSATDLILSLVDEVEDSLCNKKETVSLATFDVNGAFDAVSPNRMVRRLVDQGWPNKVCRWVQSFTNRREADLTLDGQTGDMSPLGGRYPKAHQYPPYYLCYLWLHCSSEVPTYADTQMTELSKSQVRCLGTTSSPSSGS